VKRKTAAAGAGRRRGACAYHSVGKKPLPLLEPEEPPPPRAALCGLLGLLGSRARLHPSGVLGVRLWGFSRLLGGFEFGDAQDQARDDVRLPADRKMVLSRRVSWARRASFRVPSRLFGRSL
jgi:hypothetical protein